MKKFYLYILMLMPVFALTSCEDAEIASTLEGTWKGNMYISTEHGGEIYDATYTEITFEIDPFYFSKGSGYWVDYYDTKRYPRLSRPYVANHIDWEVNNRTIYIHFLEEGTSLRISDYRLSNNRFRGTLYDGNRIVEFDFDHTYSPNWNDYSYWGYDHWLYNFFTRGEGEGASDSTAVTPLEKPRRFIREK